MITFSIPLFWHWIETVSSQIRTLEVFEPLMSREDFDEFEKDLTEFEKNEGPKLHKMLERRWFYSKLTHW